MPILYKSEFLNQDVFIWHLTESEEALQNKIPSEKVPDYNYPPRRKAWLGTRCLLNEMYATKPVLKYNEYGKPYLNKPEHVSISHSGKLIAIARGNINCGIDLQEFSPTIERILPKFLNKQEVNWLATKAKKTDYHHLIWCAKEAIFKVFGHDVDFKRDITICDFNAFKKGEFKAHVIRKNATTEFKLAYSVMDNYYLVFTHE